LSVVEVEAGMMTETRPFEILLAEDSPADAELVREALKEHHLNCSLRVISDGAQAIEFIDRIDRARKLRRSTSCLSTFIFQNVTEAKSSSVCYPRALCSNARHHHDWPEFSFRTGTSDWGWRHDVF
jgi:hypothetical protein